MNDPNEYEVPEFVKKKTHSQQNVRRKGFWQNRENRRQFFIDLATSKGLDPFHPDTWKKITRKDLRAFKVSFFSLFQSSYFYILQGDSMVRQFHLRKAVADAFPEIEFDAEWLKGFFSYCLVYFSFFLFRSTSQET
jgi:hypothetical protein